MLTFKVKDVEKKFKVYQDNVRIFEALMSSNGQLISLDYSPYRYWLSEFGIEFSCPV